MVAEDFYKNDYPDGEESSSGTCLILLPPRPPHMQHADEWHEGSEYDDIMEYRDEQGQFNWR